jgi:type IV pilus assembly protein PilO
MAILDPLVNAPNPQKIILGVMGLVIVGALGYFLLVSPKVTERDSLLQRNDSLRAEVIKGRADEANLRQFRVQAAALRKRLEEAKERLPLEKEMPGLYRSITDVARQTGLAVAVFAPKAPEEREVFSEVPIALTAESTYHQLGAFLARVARLPRIVTLNDFRLTAIQRPTGTLRAELTLATYIFRSEGAPPPAARPGGAPAPAPAPPGLVPTTPGPGGARR